MSTRKHSSQPNRPESDLDKIKRQWRKLSGLHDREEWSAVVVRAATAAEIAVNFAIRQEFEKRQSQLDAAFIDGLLRWANGLPHKLDKLLLPLTKGRDTDHKAVESLRKHADVINGERNGIVHSGAFCNKSTATKIVEACRLFVLGIAHLYTDDFTLPSGGYPSTKRQPSGSRPTEGA